MHHRAAQTHKLRRPIGIVLTGGLLVVGTLILLLPAGPSGAGSASGSQAKASTSGATSSSTRSSSTRRAKIATVTGRAATSSAATSTGAASASSPKPKAAPIIGSASASAPPPTAATSGAARPRVFAYYYLWWSVNHWKGALGSHYPSTAAPLPLPAQLDANGCHPKSLYSGNTLTDVPRTLYSQDSPGVIEADVREAAAAGLTGFIVNWAGSGASGQTLTSTPYNGRLQLMVNAVHKVNAAGIPFKLWLSYKASATVLPLSHIDQDLNYILAKYAHDPAFDRAQSPRLTIIWQGSRKYATSALQTISGKYRSAARILGDESSWSTSRAPYLDGNAYYWSSQNPYSNPQSFTQLAALANMVRVSGTNPDGTRKVWVAPLTPGFDTQLAGGSACVPRRNGQTLGALFTGNAATHPDAFGLISWNEVTEATYIDPMTRYGSQSLTVLSGLIKKGA